MGKHLPPCIEHQNVIKFLKYVSLIFIIILGSITILASGGGGDSENDSANNTDDTSNSDSSGGTPTKVVLYEPKSLFISNTNSSEVAAASQVNSIKIFQTTQDDITGENKLYQITQDDDIVEVIFLDENDSELEVETTYIKYLNASHIYIEFSVMQEGDDISGGSPPPMQFYSYTYYYAIINLESGIIYDLSEFSVGVGGDNILGITNNLLFLISNSTLYNIDLSTMVATPMNNSEYDPIDWISSFFIYYNESLNKSYVAIQEETPDVPSIKIYCTDNSLPVETLIEDYSSYMYWVAFNHKIYSDNNVYFVNGVFAEEWIGSTEFEISSYIRYGPPDYFLDSIKIYQISIDDTKIPTVELVSTSDLQPDPLCSEGIVETAYTPIDSSTTCLFGKTGKITITSDNGVTAEFESIDFSEIDSGIYNKDYIYYVLDDSIKRASISDGTSFTILTDSNLIEWYIVGDFIFYTKFITATQVNTYKILKDGTGSPELVSSSDMEIIQVVELVL